MAESLAAASRPFLLSIAIEESSSLFSRLARGAMNIVGDSNRLETLSKRKQMASRTEEEGYPTIQQTGHHKKRRIDVTTQLQDTLIDLGLGGSKAYLLVN